MTSPSELAEKVARLAAVLDAHGASSLTLSTAPSLSWLLGGARVSVPYAGPPVCTATVARDGHVVVTALTNEAARLRAEEVSPQIEVREVAWFEALAPPSAGGLDEASIAPDLQRARASLVPAERERYARLGAEVARGVGDALRRARPDQSETELAALLVAAVVRAGAEPVVVLVAGEARSHIPHPLPTHAPLGRRALAVVGARRNGLIVNLSRWVAVDPRPTAIEAALREVEADAYAATGVGRPLREVLLDIAAAYERHGFGADAWLRHHQGGPTGYLGRDPKATPDSAQLVADHQAFAWNPWAPGAKCEDTLLREGDDWRVLTVDPDWPTTLVQGRPRPLPLEMENT